MPIKDVEGVYREPVCHDGVVVTAKQGRCSLPMAFGRWVC